ncbi:ribonuclease HI [Sinorhizobium meliloti]|uniref:RNase H family protein n=1 Tax=Rhizobium meliloti TaxID=382 RepID=UPI001297DEF9|nr:RNase H family protein [Sinorhizobium meliloti]MQW47438.1 ribonuclease HI [Sinorhizobium meliloti]
MIDALHVYADGSFDAASYSGGWAFVVMDADRQFHAAAGATTGSSNNTFEVMSVVEAVSWLASEAPSATALIWTDSAHVVEGCSRWRHIWRGNGWKRVRANSHERRRPIPDVELWQELDALLELNPSVRVQLCKGHSGIVGNEIADAAARAAITSIR